MAENRLKHGYHAATSNRHSRVSGNPLRPQSAKSWIPAYYLGNDGLASMQMTVGELAGCLEELRL
jgi:hypothetical protein